MIRQNLLPEDLREKLKEMGFHFQSGSVSEAFESYLRYEGIIGYGDQIIQALQSIQKACIPELNESQRELLDYAHLYGGIELPQEDWPLVQTQVKLGLASLSPARGPRGKWKRLLLTAEGRRVLLKMEMEES